MCHWWVWVSEILRFMLISRSWHADSSGVVELGMGTLHSVSLQSCNYIRSENRTLFITWPCSSNLSPFFLFLLLLVCEEEEKERLKSAFIFTLIKSTKSALCDWCPLISSPPHPQHLHWLRTPKDPWNTFPSSKIFSEVSKSAWGELCLFVLFIQLVEEWKSGCQGYAAVWALFCSLLRYFTCVQRPGGMFGKRLEQKTGKPYRESSPPDALLTLGWLMR